VALVKSYTDQYPQDINVQVKFFPLIRAHQHAIRSAVYTQCAAMQGKFWDYLHKIMATQMQWSSLINADGVFGQIAKEVGLNQDHLDRCLNDERIKDMIEADRQLGVSLQVQSTPTYFINNKMVVGPKALEETLKSLLGNNE
jgi:protein-disulfide isomerase